MHDDVTLTEDGWKIADDAELDRMAEVAENILNGSDGYHRAIADAVAEVVGHNDTPGDVDPLATCRWRDATRAVIRQLVENGTVRANPAKVAAEALNGVGIAADVEYIGCGDAATVYIGAGHIWVTDAEDHGEDVGYIVGIYRHHDDEGDTQYYATDAAMVAAVQRCEKALLAEAEAAAKALSDAHRRVAAESLAATAETRRIIGYRLNVATADEVESAGTMVRRALTMTDPGIAYPMALLLAEVADADPAHPSHTDAMLIAADGEVIASYEVQ